MTTATATVSLKLETKDFATKANDASTALLGVQLAAGGTGIALKGMAAVARSSVAEFTLGAVAVDRFNNSLGKAATNAGKISAIAGTFSNLAYNTALATTAISGLVEATSAFNRIPQTLASISASGVNTATIEEFQQMREAIGGNTAAVEGFVNTAIARLGVFEQAAARSATILKSSTRFDESGNALRVNGAESLANALSIQRLVTNKLDNAITSSAALLAQYEVLSAGFANQADSEKVLETALKLTQIGQAGGVASNAGDNAKLIGKSLQAYNLGAGDAARTGAILNEVVAQGITTVPELSNGFGAAASSASRAGVSMSALGAGVAQLTSLGQDTSEALTGLKGLSDAIVNKTPEAAAELAKLSLNGQRVRFDVAEVQAKGLVQALLDVNKAAGNSPQILAKIFPDAVTSRAVTGLISGGGAGFKSRFDAIDSASAASLDEVAQKASDTQVNRMEKLANKFGEIIISIAQSVAPVVEPGLATLKRIADAFAAIPDPVKQALGSWIAAQVMIQSTGAAIGILAKTLGDLAAIYAVGRIISLTMSGQLGAELTVVRQLIVQRKGLAAVMLQTIGINQRHRLGVDAATAALTNQGLVAKGAYAAQAKGAELVAAASTRARDIFARNVAGARAAAAEFSVTPTGANTINAAMGLRSRVEGVAAAVNNSQTAQNVRGAVGGFLERNPAIGTAASEVRSAAASALERAQNKFEQFTQSDLYNRATTVTRNVAESVKNRAGEVLSTDSGAADRARLQQLVNASLSLNKSKLLTTVTDTRAKFAEIDKETTFRQRLQNSKKEELNRQQDKFNKQSQRLEELKSKVSSETYEKGVAKLNRDAQKIKDLEANIQENARPLAELQRDRARLNRQLVGAESQLATANIAAQGRFTPLVNLESKLQRVNAATERATARAVSLEAYAANVNRIAPNSPQALAATNAAGLAAITRTSLAGRAQTLDAQYQALLTSSGARTALLAQQGLAQVRFGGATTTYNNSGLERVLYADVKKAMAGAIGVVSTAFTYVTTNAGRAAVALGNLARSAVLQPLGAGTIRVQEYVRNLFGRVGGGITEAFRQGGLSGVVRSGFDRYISGTATLGQRALPMLPPQIAGAVAPLALTAAAGALILRDDIKRGQLTSEFTANVETTLKKDRELQSKYDTRTQPLIQLKTDALKISDIKGIDPVREQLKQLQKNGELTAEQFADLDESLIKVGASGKISADELSRFTAKLDGIRAQDKPISKGFAQDFADNVYNTPGRFVGGLGKALDGGANLVGGAIGSLTRSVVDSAASGIKGDLAGVFTSYDPRKITRGIAGTQSDREADSLVGSDGKSGLIGEKGSLTKIINATLDASIQSRENILSYREGTALDKANALKIASGKVLDAIDLDREKAITATRIARNQALTADYDNQIKILDEQLGKISDPGVKAAFQNSIDIYKKNKEALEKNTEGLKAAETAFNKYNAETLPNLIRALNETASPAKAVGYAAEDFNQIYQKDASGELTKYVKDIAVLRAESGKYIEAIVTKYGTDNSAAAESEAIEQLKSVRDNRITLSTGDSGFRDTIATRMALTDQIVKIQQAESQRIIADRTLTGEKLKVMTTNGSIAEQEARIKSQDLGIEIAQKNLEVKQKEIEEYAQFPRKVVELEQQAATLRVQLEQQVADKQKAIRERDFALKIAQFDLQSEYLKTAQAELRVGGVDAIEQAAKIELDKARASLEKLYRDRSRLSEDSPELNNQIVRAEQNYQQQAANTVTQIFDARQQLAKQLISLDASKAIQPLSVENKTIESYQKIGDLRSSILSTNRELLNTNLDIEQSQLSNQSKLTGSAVARAEIELTSAKAKLSNLGAVQAFERESLILQQELTELGFKQQQNQLNISRIEQQRTIRELELQKLRLDRDKSNSPESKAAREENEIAIKNARIQLGALDTQSEVLTKQAQTNKQINDAKLKQNTATSANARETERINLLLADINTKTAGIADTNEKQNLIYTAQNQKLTAQSNAIELTNKQLENRSKILTTQQGLVSAIGDARASELQLMDGLTTIDSVKLTIAQQVATVKLSSLRTQMQYEKDILELNLQQQKATYEQDKLKQQMAEKGAERDILNSRAALEKLRIKGNLADPNEVRAAELDYSSKLDAAALVRGNRDILAQQGAILDYSGKVERYKLDITQKGQLQGALASVGATMPTAQKAEFENTLFNAVASQQGNKYYEQWADGVIKAAKLNPVVLPRFDSPYSGNYNRPGVAEPNKQSNSSRDLYRSNAGSIDFTQPINAPSIQQVDMSRYQRNAEARYREFVVNPVRIEISPQVRQSQQEGRRTEAGGRRNEDKPVKPIIIQGLQVTNDMKISVANSGEGKAAIENNFLSSFEGVVRLIKEKY